jgi:sugar lactone lactonase YvrE
MWKGSIARAISTAISVAGAAVLATIVAVAGTPGSSGDTTADRVLGQVDFVHNGINLVNANGFWWASAVAIDQHSVTKHLYASDVFNSRVLGWNDAASFSNGAPADLVIGRPDFTFSEAQGPTECSPPSAMTLCYPGGLTVDSAGNLYVVDGNNYRVLEFDAPFSSGTTTGQSAHLVFGQGGSFTTRDYGTGKVSADTLGGPIRLASDSAGNLFVADSNDNRVLVFYAPLAITASGRGDTTADMVFGQHGSFTSNEANNGGLSADSLNLPTGVAVDSGGNVYISDQSNNRVLEYDVPVASQDTTADLVIGQNGNFVSKVCSNGNGTNPPPSASGLCYPGGLAMDSADSLFVSDQGNSRVLKYMNPINNGTVAEVVIGEPNFTTNTFCNGGGSPNASFFCGGDGVAVDGVENLYVADGPNNRVLSFSAPFTNGMAADRELGQVDFVHTGLNFMDARSLYFPQGVAIDTSVIPNRLYAADTFNNRVLGWEDVSSFTNGAAADIVIGQADFLTGSGNSGPSATDLSVPQGVAVDSAGNLYVADTNYNRVLEYDNPFSSGSTAGQAAHLVFGRSDFTSTTCTPGDCLYLPKGVAVDAIGNLWVSNTSANEIFEYKRPLALQDGLGAGDTLHDLTISGYCPDNLSPIGAGSLCQPMGITLDAGGNLYVADNGDARVLEFDNPTTTDTAPDRVFGQSGKFTTNACLRPTAGADRLCAPGGVALDASGNLYITDNQFSAVAAYQKPLTSAPPAAVTVFGYGSNVSADSLLFHNASGSIPGSGAAIDAAGNLYVTDTLNGRILEYDKPLPPSITPTQTPTRTSTRTPSPTPTTTSTRTATRTPTRTPTPSASPRVSAALAVSPNLLNFGNVKVGSAKKKKVTLTNTSPKKGGATITLQGVDLPSGTSFAINGTTCPGTLGPKKKCKVGVIFAPRRLGTATATVTVVDNAINRNQTFRVIGNGITKKKK